MTDAEHDAVLAGQSRTHALVRTSPKGALFLGACIQCGMKNLPMRAALEPCLNQRWLTSGAALLEVMGEDHARR